MNKLASIQNDTGILIYLDGKPNRFEKGTKEYQLALVALNDKEDPEGAVRNIINYKRDPISTETEGFDITDEEVSYDGEVMPQVLANKVRSIVEQGLPIQSFRNFWVNLRGNPSNRAVEELLSFLEYKELPITEDGCFLAYKGVNSDGYSHHGNTSVNVLQGTVDGNGRILNEVGQTIEILRRHVCDSKVECAKSGLHVGSLDYALGYGPKYFVVKIDPKDVVSVPIDSSFQKLRTCKYEVVSEYKEEIEDSVTMKDGTEFPDKRTESYLHLKEFIKGCLFDWDVSGRFFYFDDIIIDYNNEHSLKGEKQLDTDNFGYAYYYPYIAGIVTDLGYRWKYNEGADPVVVYGSGPHAEEDDLE